MLFAWMTSIALFNANYFGFHSHHLDGVIWLTWHFWKWSIWREEWDDLFEERNTMAYSDSHEIEYGQRCDQMYITLWQRVGKLEGYRSTRNTSLWHSLHVLALYVMMLESLKILSTSVRDNTSTVIRYTHEWGTYYYLTYVGQCGHCLFVQLFVHVWTTEFCVDFCWAEEVWCAQ